MLEYLEKLQTTVWRTSGARYNASRRLKRRELFSTISLALFSAISIIIAVVQRIYSTPIQCISGLDNLLTAISICMGLFILVFTLMEWGSANGVKAYVLHKNAENLNALQSKIGHIIAKHKDNQEETISHDDVNLLRLDYEEIKGQCAENHTPTDDRFFLTSKRFSPEFKYLNLTKQEAGIAWLVWNASSIWYYAGLWVITILVMWHALSKIIPA
ncbi:SLATT domain-containing protein [Pseudomonas tructae]|uniref:SLATT domain-containing protein n=1 Tax=Pseudomonas tructae TaxID=2518644 RepID=A0A411MNX0_9PSED|nr:SLATT domain-containing protein [Pseudomonas tructae]QBF28493.1 SLATT domain-containing protein [Pseudomonas tructae]